MVNLTIDGQVVSAEEHTSILNAALSVGIHIPTLCYLAGINDVGACRVCLVEIEGIDTLVASCNNEIHEGMVVWTNSPKVRSARKTNVSLLLSQHDSECPSCARSGNCQLQKTANDLGIVEVAYEKHLERSHWDRTFPLIRDTNKCIKCLRCVEVCDKIQASDVWDLTMRASRSTIGVAGGITIDKSDCTLCGQCITHCPTAALRERDDTDRVFAALADPEIITLVQLAPSVRTAWGESLGLPREKATAKRLVAALRMMGFDYVFDTDFSADLTIMEEGAEFVDKLKRREAGEEVRFPMFTSCCPGWVRYLKAHHPEMIDQLSSAKSPQGMFGAVAKSYFAQRNGIDPNKIFSMSIMPCLAKKHECALESLNDAGAGRDVDCSITVREIVRMLREEHIDVQALREEEFDAPLGTASGAGAIFGATGGVMEAALRSASYLVTGENPDPDAFRQVRGQEGWKEAEYDIAGTTLRVAVASGLSHVRDLLDALASGRAEYDFVEMMACPGGCVGGGGQPIHEARELAEERGKVLYGLDKRNDLRFSHENPSVQVCYRDFFDAPLSEKAEKYLHTDHHAWSMPHR